MNKIKGGVGVLTRPNGQDARPTEWVINWVINIVQLLTNLNDGCDRWIFETRRLQPFNNPKSKIQNGTVLSALSIPFYS
jgi:hypothetical protein